MLLELLSLLLGDRLSLKSMLDNFIIFDFFTLFLLSLGFDLLRLLAGGILWRLLRVSFLAIGIEHSMVLIRDTFKDSLNPRNKDDSLMRAGLVLLKKRRIYLDLVRGERGGLVPRSHGVESRILFLLLFFKGV